MMDFKKRLFINQHLMFQNFFTKNKGTDSVFNWISKGVHNSKLKPLSTASYIAKNFLDKERE